MTTTAEALGQLTKAGKSAQARQVLEQAVTAARRSYEPLQRDSTTSASHKKTLLARSFKEQNKRVAAELTKLAQAATVQDRADAAAVFGINGMVGDKASLTIAQRDAQDRAAKLDNAAELEAALARATRQGDEGRARAYAERAVELKLPTVLDAFLADRPDLTEAVNRVWDANGKVTSDQLRDNIINGALVANLKPAELAKETDYQIDVLAEPAPAQR